MSLLVCCHMLSSQKPNNIVICSRTLGLTWAHGIDCVPVLVASGLTALRIDCNADSQHAAGPHLDLHLQAKYAWVTGLSADDAAWMAELPFTLSVPSRNIIIAHAGVLPGVPLSHQSLADLYTVRIMIVPMRYCGSPRLHDICPLCGIARSSPLSTPCFD